MKILTTGDLHIRSTPPSERIDDYLETQNEKIKQIVNIAYETDCNLILIPGDFFDNPRVKLTTIVEIINILKSIEIPIITIYGQHDLYYRSKENSILTLLVKIGQPILIADKKPIVLENNSIHVYGASFDEEIPKIKNPNVYNILLIHKMIINQEKLWEGQENYTQAEFLIKSTQFDLIAAGDNHQSFSVNIGKRFLNNPGSLMRMAINQKNHEPCVYLTDTDKQTNEKIKLGIKENVFRFTQEMKKENDYEETVNRFVGDLKDSSVNFFDFIEIVKVFLKKNDIKKEVKTIIKEIIYE